MAMRSLNHLLYDLTALIGTDAIAYRHSLSLGSCGSLQVRINARTIPSGGCLWQVNRW